VIDIHFMEPWSVPVAEVLPSSRGNSSC